MVVHTVHKTPYLKMSPVNRADDPEDMVFFWEVF